MTTFSPAQLQRAETRFSSGVVLCSQESSTGTQPPHHSAARTDVVLLIRRTVRRVRLRFLLRLRPCWDVILSILRDSELFDAERLFACVLGSEPDEVRVIPLGSYLHTVFKNLAPTQDPKSRFF